MNDEAWQKIQDQLSPGESLLWSGRPPRGMRLTWWDLILVPFSLLWGGGVLFIAFHVFSAGAPLFSQLIVGAFAVMGVYIVFGRFIVDALRRGHTYYGVSNDRVLIVSEFPTSRVKSLGLSTLSDVTLSTKRDQSGSISFGPQDAWAGMFAGSGWPGTGSQGSRFERIENAKSVYDIIQKAKRDLR